MAEADASTVLTAVVDDPHIRDLHVSSVAVEDDRATGVGTGDRDSIDSGLTVAGQGEPPVVGGVRQNQHAGSLFGPKGCGLDTTEGGLLTGHQGDVTVGDEVTDLIAPDLQSLGGRFDRGDPGPFAPTLELDRFPHDHHFLVDPGGDHDEVVGFGPVDGGLDCGVIAGHGDHARSVA